MGGAEFQAHEIDQLFRVRKAGDGLSVPDMQARSKAMGDIEAVLLKAVPMDSRHNSKADYAKLKKLLA